MLPLNLGEKLRWWMGAKQNAPVIIKRKKVSGGGGHHGGAWKVAMIVPFALRRFLHTN